MSEGQRRCSDCAYLVAAKFCSRAKPVKVVRGYGVTGVRAVAERSSDRSLFGRVKCGRKGKFFHRKAPL